MVPSRQFQNKINIARTLNLLWTRPGISRTEVAGTLGLDKSTITDGVQKLVDVGIVEEWKQGYSTPGGGRKPQFLRLREDFGVVLGVEIRFDGYRAVISNIYGRVLGTYAGRHSLTKDALVVTLGALVRELVAKAEAGGHRVLACGVGISGIIDPHRGTIRYSIPLGISRSLALGDELSSFLTLPILLENDANACAWAEILVGEVATRPNSFIAVLGEIPESDALGDGYGFSGGLGIFLNQRIYRGQNFFGGEFRSIGWQGEPDGQFSVPKSQLARFRQDPSIRKVIFDELAAQIGLLANTLDCDGVYLCRDLEAYAVEFSPILEESIRRNWSYEGVHPRKLILTVSSYGENAVAVGAAAFVLHTLFGVPDYGTETGNQEARLRDVIMEYLS
ncbi:MAG: ROK family protein [Spirochaetales bacterium]|nr:ROK family protein [Spirochaetales bacterium]